MSPSARGAFLALILTQAAHSAEEYALGLVDVWAPARFVSGLVSDDVAFGFVAVNVGLVLCGLWCYVARVRPGHPSGRAYAWFWTLLELANGIGHGALAWSKEGYFPGVATAPLLLAVSTVLAVLLSISTPRAS